ncbi:MAG TPA: PIN domain-containing protein [Syntrophales bacterium]|jgi:predicted nucleic acid-binding protein|nr:PIN domain-containing protein [Syntrophales bacterium]HPC33693.1 PIN domain-containing protein [Syntrophales bacterium]HQG34140.1 PIN domain-containing protein [Syntrophales bacterium]
MKILLDTNVVLDLLLDRKPFSDDAAELFSLIENRVVNGCLCATTVTTIFYLIAKARGYEAAKKAVHSLLLLFEVAAVSGEILVSALESAFRDYEDAVIYRAAKKVGTDMIVTRNERDFPVMDIALYNPSEALKIIHELLS